MNYFRANKILVCIIISSFLLSISYSFYHQIRPAVDARAYDTIATNIINGNGYREDLSLDLTHDLAITRVGPLYEYFLAGIYKIFGHHYGTVWIIQALLHALTAWFVYLIALLVFANSEQKKKVGLWASAIIGFHPDLMEISSMLLTETLYLFLVCLLFYLFFKYFSQQTKWGLINLALISGLAVLARPPVLFLMPIIVFFFWSKKEWLSLTLFLIILFLVFVPWTIRNYQVYGEIMPFGAAGNYNFWIGNWHGGDGEQSPQPFHSAFVDSHEVQDINGESMRQFKLFLQEHPTEFLKLTVLRVSKYFSIIRPMGFWFYQQGIGKLLMIVSSALASVFLFVFGLAGIVKAFKEKNLRLKYLLALIVVTPLIIFITVVETRYRFQIYPLLAIFAGYYLMLLGGTKKWWVDKILWLAMFIITLNGLVDLLLSFGKFKEKLGGFF